MPQVKLWDTETGACLQTYNVHQENSNVTACAWLPDGQVRSAATLVAHILCIESIWNSMARPGRGPRNQCVCDTLSFCRSGAPTWWQQVSAQRRCCALMV